MKTKELFKRYFLFVLCLFFMGLGIAMTKHAGLGVSAISSLPNIISLRFNFFSFGTWLTVSNIIYLSGQIILLRKKFQPIQLLQLPLAFIFGYFTDLGLLISSFIPNNIYAVQFITTALGVFILGFGISLGVIANTVLTSAEGLVKAISVVSGKKFSNIKIAVDISWVVVTVILSIVFYKDPLVGVREGTVYSAIFTGLSVKFCMKHLEKPLEKFLIR